MADSIEALQADIAKAAQVGPDPANAALIAQARGEKPASPLAVGGAPQKAAGAIAAGPAPEAAPTPSPTQAPAPAESLAPPAPKAAAPTNAQNFQDGIARVRAAGYSWEDIGQQLAPKFEQARNAGFTPKEIAQNLGFSSSDPILAAVKNHLQDVIPGDGSVDVEKIRGIYADAIHDQRVTHPRDYAKALIGKAGEVLEGIGKGAVAGATAGWEEKQPGENAFQTLGRILKTDLNAPLGAVQGAVEGGFAAAGAPRLGRDLAAMPEAFMGSPGAFHTGVESVAKKLPTPNDLTDNAIALQLKTTGKVGNVKPVVDNLVSGWAKTGEDPAVTVQRADHDPHLAQQLLVEQPRDPPLGSSENPTGEAGTFVIPKNAPEPTEAPTQHGVVRATDKAEPADIAMAQSGRVSHNVKSFLEQGGQDLDPTSLNWCAAFTNSALEQAGIKGSGSNVATSFLKWGDEVDAQHVAKSDVVVISRGHAAGETGGHVGIATGDTRVTARGTEVEMVSGNSSGTVRTTWEPADHIDIRRSNGEASTAKARPDELGLIRSLENTGDNAVSPKGAQGRYQMMPATAREMGYDPERMSDPAYAREAAQKYLDKIHSMGITRTEDVLVAWDAGPGAARKWIDGGRHFEELPAETQKYLERARDQHGVIPSSSYLVEGETPRPPKGQAGFIGHQAAKTPEELATDDMLGRIGGEPGWKDRVEEFGKNAYRELIDPDHPVNKLIDAVEKGTPLPDDLNPRFFRRLTETADSTAQNAIERKMTDLEGNETGPGFKEIVEPVGKRGQDFTGYGIARWALEKAGQSKETGVDLGNAMLVANTHNARFGKAFDQLVEFQNGSLRWLKDAGFYTKEQLAHMIAQNKSRIPGYRVDDEGKLVKGGTGGGASSGVKQFFGSKEKIQNPIKSILQDTYVRAQIARRNIANMKVVDAAQTAGLANKVRVLPTKFDLSPAEITHLGIQANDAAIWRRLGHDLRPDEVPVWRDGKLEAWEVKDANGKVDRDLINSLRGMDHQQIGVWQKLMAPAAKLQRAGIALSPTFPIRNILFDLPWQFIIKPGAQNPVAWLMRGISGMAKGELKDWYNSGSAERAWNGMSKDAHVRDIMGQMDPNLNSAVWNAVRTPYHLLQAWTTTLPTLMRGGRYLQGIDRGESQIRASAASTEAVFHRAGFGGPQGKLLNSVHPFTLAHLNALNETVKSLFGIGKNLEGDPRVAWHAWAKASAIITVPMIANWAAFKDEEWYKAAPNWQKDTGLLMPVGGHTLYVPLPPLLGFLFGGLPRRILDGWHNDQSVSKIAKDALTGALTSALPSSSLFFAGNVLQPIVEHIANHSFFRNAPLVSDQAKKNLGPEQASPWASGIAKTMSRFLPNTFSPAVIDNYIQGWAGTLGVAAVKTADMLAGTGPRAGNAPALSIEDMPLLSSWLARYPSASAQPIKDFGDARRHFEEVHGSLISAMKSGDVDRFKEILAANPGEATAHKFSIGKEAGAIIGEQPTASQFLPLLQGTPRGNQQDVQEFLTMQNSVTEMNKWVSIYRAAPVTQSLPTWNVDTGQPMEHKLMTPMDKRQQLDAIYTMMQRASEKGLAAYQRLTK